MRSIIIFFKKLFKIPLTPEEALYDHPGPVLVVKPKPPPGAGLSVVRVPAGPVTTLGVDVSHFEPVVDWAAVKASGRVFAFAKATDGTGSIDTAFLQHRWNAKDAGLTFGAYHFLRYHSKLTPTAQADLFLSAMGGVEVGELPPVLDVERSEGLDELGAYSSLVLECLDRIESQCGMTPIIYTSASFFTGFKNPEVFKRYPLWVANYHALAPLTPPPWTSWAFWQRAEDEPIPGVGKGDGNVFNGSLDELRAMVKKPSGAR